MNRLAGTILGLIALCGTAWAQSAILQGGPITPGHVPMYVGTGTQQPVVQDAGGAGGGGVGVGLSELGLTARGTGTAPYSGQGTGPLGTNLCDFDAPITNPSGYHYLCWSANGTGGNTTMAAGAAGGAAPLPFVFNLNGTSYAFPGAFSAITVGTTGVVGGSNGLCLYINGVVVGAQSCAAATITVGTTQISGGTSNGLLYDNGGNLGNLATANSGVLVTSAGGIPSISTILPSALTIPAPTVSGTIAGNPTLAGTWNFTGTFEVNGTTETFPSSGILVGTTDTQVLTNKSIAGSEINSGTVAGTYLAAINLATSGNGGVTGQLGYSNGGCNASTQTGCTNNIFPSPTRAGDVAYWNGSSWLTLPGNNSGNQTFQENASGVPSWATVAGTGTVTTFTAAALPGVIVSGNTTITTTGTFDYGIDTTYFPTQYQGLTLSNDAVTANTVLDVAAGAAVSDDDSTFMKTAAVTKSLNSTWAVGTGNGCLETTSAIGASLTYYIYEIERTDTSVVDILCSQAPNLSTTGSGIVAASAGCTVTWANHGLQAGTPVVLTGASLPTGVVSNGLYYVIGTSIASGTFEISATYGGSAITCSGSTSGSQTITAAPVLPANYTKKQLVGFAISDASSHIRKFTQVGRKFFPQLPLLITSGTTGPASLTSILINPEASVLVPMRAITVDMIGGSTANHGGAQQFNFAGDGTGTGFRVVGGSLGTASLSISGTATFNPTTAYDIPVIAPGIVYWQDQAANTDVLFVSAFGF